MNKMLSLVFLICIGVATAGLANDRPNIVLIMADDLGGRDLPVYGNEFNESPHIDTLAEQGMVFINAYAAPVCSATRASIQAGQYPARLGIFDFIPGHWRPNEEVTVPHHKVQHLPADIVTIGDTLQAAGYVTGYFGKWHLNEGARHLPNTRGYTEAYTYTAGLNGFYKPTFAPAYEGDADKRVSLVLTDMGVNFIEKNKDQPFFLFLSHFDVHVQLDADQDLIDKYKAKDRNPDYPGNAVYAAMIEHVDDSVGAIMQRIEDLGLADNTIFIFYSDNGGIDNRFDDVVLLGGKSRDTYPEGHPLQYIATSNVPLRAGKGTLYEGGIRVPLIVRWPGKVPAGLNSEAIVSSVDFYPTLIEAAGARAPENQVLDGISMLPALTTDTYDPEREVFTHYPVYHHEQPMSALRKGDWKIVENLVTGEVELFNLKYDVNEMTDLKFSHEEKAREMKVLLAGWQARTAAENPVPNPDFDASKRYQWGKNPHVQSRKYKDGRPEAKFRMDATDHGIVLRYGDCPTGCDILGARDVWVFEDNGKYYMHYDGAGKDGWLSSLAVSTDLINWEKKGPILDFGAPGSNDSKGACYGVTYQDGDSWHMFYLGTPNASPAPELIPTFPYLTLKAKSESPEGPWVKEEGIVLELQPDTYYSATASPGHVIKTDKEYLQFFSASTHGEETKRTLGIARAQDLDGPWSIDPEPIVPLEEQIENSSLYYEESIDTWFLFTNHIGLEEYEYTDAVWVYWSKDLNHWDADNKAVVLDGENCTWANKAIGLPSVLPVGNRLALFYDAPEGDSTSHMRRHVGLAWLELPLSVPD